VEEWAGQGRSGTEIAELMGVRPATVQTWKKKSPAFQQALERGRNQASIDMQVEKALFEAATGHVVTLRKPVKVKEEKNRPGEGKQTEEKIVYAREQVYVAPKITAQMFWLKCRRPEIWGGGGRAAEAEQEMASVAETYAYLLNSPLPVRTLEALEAAEDGENGEDRVCGAE